MQPTLKTSSKEDLMQEQILQAAQHLFQKHGFQKVAMEDVAKAIGKGRSSLYYYYKSKDEIFHAVIDVEIRDIISELNRAVDQGATVEEKIRAFCLAKIRIARKKRSFFSALESGMNADEISQYAKKKLEMSNRLIRQEAAILREVAAQGIKNRELSKMGTAEMETTVFVVLSSIHGLKMAMLAGNDLSRLESSVDVLTGMAMRAFGK